MTVFCVLWGKTVVYCVLWDTTVLCPLIKDTIVSYNTGQYFSSQTGQLCFLWDRTVLYPSILDSILSSETGQYCDLWYKTVLCLLVLLFQYTTIFLGDWQLMQVITLDNFSTSYWVNSYSQNFVSPPKYSWLNTLNQPWLFISILYRTDDCTK